MENSYSIKAWAEEDQPREKLFLKGKSVLSDAELIAIVIGSGVGKETAVDLSKRLLHECANNDLSKLARLNVSDFTKIKGIGKAKAISIIAALELGRRRRDNKPRDKIVVQSSSDAYEIARTVLGDLSHEEFYIIHLNRANQLIGTYQLSKGGITGTVADCRLIFKSALDNMATGIILCHNHPSGNLKPSKEDINLTKRVFEAGKILEIPVLDHIIISDDGYYSFADDGALY